jgi:DNA-binding transcriptional LysR family regulator
LQLINLPTDLLRAFVSVIDLGGFTKAADALGRSQPAISLQLRRLEDLIGAKVIIVEGRSLKLTEEGETLIVYARQLLRLNDEAIAKFSANPSGGLLRIGLPTDFASAYLQEVISEFARNTPGVKIEIHCDLSRQVLHWLHSNELDIAIGILNRDSNPYLVRSWEERPIWAAATEGDTHRRRPIPLASHPEGCEYRSRMTAALRAIGREWRIVYTNPGIGGLQRAVSTGLGVSALTRKTLLPDMRILSIKDGFPELETIKIGLFYKHPRLTAAGLTLVDTLIAHMDEAAEPAKPGPKRAGRFHNECK